MSDDEAADTSAGSSGGSVGMSEEPLHVQVAVALGRQASISYEVMRGTGTAIGFDRRSEADTYLAERHARGWMAEYSVVEFKRYPRYDEDWSVTGPLIEWYRLSVRLSAMPRDEAQPWTAWAGPTDLTGDATTHGPTPLVAVCRLLLALHAAGKLER